MSANGNHVGEPVSSCYLSSGTSLQGRKGTSLSGGTHERADLVLTHVSLLDNLDEDLMSELDQVVRDNQLARCPFAKSGRADLLLHERYPGLAEDIDEERQTRIKAMAYRPALRDAERKLSSSVKTKFGSFDDVAAISPPLDRNKRKSKVSGNEPFSPDLRPKNSKADLMFDMDEEGSSIASPSPSPRPLDPSLKDELDQLPSLAETWNDVKGKGVRKPSAPTLGSPAGQTTPGTTPVRSSAEVRRVSHSGSPWAPSSLSTTRLDLKDIMAESKPGQSALAAGLAEQKSQAASQTTQKMSQKERKKFMQQQADGVAEQETLATQKPQAAWTQVGEKTSSPWQPTPAAPKTSMKDSVISDPKSTLAPPGAKPVVTSESSSISIPRRAASPDTRFAGQNRSGSAIPHGKPSRPSIGSQPASSVPPQTSSTPPVRPDPMPLVPHSKLYIQKPKKEISSFAGLGLADVIALERAQQESVKEAAAKRNLEEIQQEQAFQEWWDAESRRIQEDESQRQNRDKNRDVKKPSGGRRGRGGKPKSSPSKDSGTEAASTVQQRVTNSTGTNSRSRGRSHRGGKPAAAQEAS